MQTWGGIWISAKNSSDAARQRDPLKLTTLAAITVRRCQKTLALFRWNYSTVHFSVFFFFSVVKNSKTTSLGAKQWLSSRERLLHRQVQASQLWATNLQEENISTCCVLCLYSSLWAILYYVIQWAKLHLAIGILESIRLRCSTLTMGCSTQYCTPPNCTYPIIQLLKLAFLVEVSRSLSSTMFLYLWIAKRL